MPRYWSIREWDDVSRERVLAHLLRLRTQLHAEVSSRRTLGSVLLATWNIRDFDSNKFGHGPRLPESFHYIAEIVSAFDLVALQEVNRDLSALERVMGILGDDWNYIVTDTTEGAGGNEERMAFVFDTRKIRFRNIAGEVVLAAGQKIVAARKVRSDRSPDEPTIEEDEIQFARTPFLAAFQAGWFKFNLSTVHIYFGSSSGVKLQRRVDEINSIAHFFSKRQNREREDYILVGDFNIVSPQHRTMEALTNEGFVIPENLQREKTNLKGDKHYDQIALKVQEKRLEIGASGVFDFSKSVFRDGELPIYRDLIPSDLLVSASDEEKYYRDKWRTFQMSDHLPMWVQLKVDFTDDYLESLKPGHHPLADV